MSDSIIDKATTVVYTHLNGETRFALSDADCIVNALRDASLLRPESDDAMIERGYEAFVRCNPDLGEDVGLADIEAALRAALGGEQND